MANIPHAARELIEQYRRYLQTSYRFDDDSLRQQFEEQLLGQEVVQKGPYVTLSQDFAAGESLPTLVAKGEAESDLLRAHWPFGDRPLHLHQQQALAAGRAGRSFVVTTGTGSGKTEAFLLPVFDGIVRSKRQGARGVQAILVYPMNALANDQLGRMRVLLGGTGLDLSFGLYTGDSDATSLQLPMPPVEMERPTREALRREPPDILLTNYKQLEFLLVRRADRAFFTPALRYLVLDELHSYSGALATEIACLIRRLKVTAGIAPGTLLGIGTSATIGSGPDAAAALAKFASVLFGEDVRPEDMLRESRKPRSRSGNPYVPPFSALSEDELSAIETKDEAAIVALAEKLTGRACAAAGSVAERVAGALAGNTVVEVLEEALEAPARLDEVATHLAAIAGRETCTPEDLAREAEAYLLVGSAGDESHPPRLRPKLHTFFHGVYDVSLCLSCRRLVPHGADRCPACDSITRPVALCRTCGHDFVKVQLVDEIGRTKGSEDWASSDRTVFLTHKIVEEDPEEDEDEEPKPAPKRRRKAPDPRKEFVATGVCPNCGRLTAVDAECPECHRATLTMQHRRGPVRTCPVCKDYNPRFDIVTPLRTGTASSVSVLTTHHLDVLDPDDRRVLVFADNRQDAAHQAGYTEEKHRSFALRHVVGKSVFDSGAEGLGLEKLVEKLYDFYVELGVIHRQEGTERRKNWKFALEYLVASEFTRHSKQRASLESLGLVAVDYEFLAELPKDGPFHELLESCGVSDAEGVNLVRAMLDVMRRRRAVNCKFFQEYVDPVKNPYRGLQEEPYDLRLPEHDRSPVAYALERPQALRGKLEGVIRESTRGRHPALVTLVTRRLSDPSLAEHFVRKTIERLIHCGILEVVAQFPLPKADRSPRIQPLQIRRDILRFTRSEHLWRCSSCRSMSPYELPFCPRPKCATGRLEKSQRNEEDYYVRLYTRRAPLRLRIAEHTAQIPAEERAKRETEFKAGRLQALVCSPTLELGVDIGSLSNVLLRNAPPTPARYAQRVGRAGRRLRIGFASTYCEARAHDRQIFDRPEWLVRGEFDPPRIRLNNPRIVGRHIRSHILEHLVAQLPSQLKELLNDQRNPTEWLREDIVPLLDEVRSRQVELKAGVRRLFERDAEQGLVPDLDQQALEQAVEAFAGELEDEFERWFRRVRMLNAEFEDLSTIGSSRYDEKKAKARQRAFREITSDPERAYVLNYLSVQGLLPAYQFPVDTFSLDPGLSDTPTLYRPAAIAIVEFAPGNYVYANGHKLRSIRVLFTSASTRGTSGGDPRPVSAEAAGRMLPYSFCDRCGEAAEGVRNNCSRCQGSMTVVDLMLAEAFEAEENFRIGGDEEARQRRFFDTRQNLVLGAERAGTLFKYPLTPVEHYRDAEVLITNRGQIDGTGSGKLFRICHDCGRHCPAAPGTDEERDWLADHLRYCSGALADTVLAYRFHTDALVITMSSGEVGNEGGLPSNAVTLAEALRQGAAQVLGLDSGEIDVFVLPPLPGHNEAKIVFYETVPGGAGYLEDMARRLPVVAQRAHERLFGQHSCAKACYLCLKHYGNQRWHALLDKYSIRSLLWMMAQYEAPEQVESHQGDGAIALWGALAEPPGEAPAPAEGEPRYRRGPIEEYLAHALAETNLPEASREFEFRVNSAILTVPDFAWEDVKLAVYCDSFEFHADRDRLVGDAKKRNQLQLAGWTVLVYWGRLLKRDPSACAREIEATYVEKRSRLHPELKRT